MGETLKQRAYRLILEKISSGALTPGSRVSNRALAKELRIGFVPVREAIIRLVGEGLVDHRPGDGTFVPKPNRQEIIDLYDFREALECHATAKMAGRMNEADLAEMTRQNEILASIVDLLPANGQPSGDRALFDRWGRADAEFHFTLLRAAGNRRALEALVDLKTLTNIFSRSIENEVLADLRRTHGEHERIIEALRLGDGDAARAEVAQHIRNGCRIVVAGLDRQRMEPAVT